MASLDDYRIEAYARKHLRASGIVDVLKSAGIVIWTVRATPGHLAIMLDKSALPDADEAIIRDEITHVLAPLQRQVDVTYRPIEGNCCYGACQGCLNGDPTQRKLWIGP